MLSSASLSCNEKEEKRNGEIERKKKKKKKRDGGIVITLSSLLSSASLSCKKYIGHCLLSLSLLKTSTSDSNKLEFLKEHP